MMRSFGVSRTVIREAVARLKAEGLVISRQGLGVFVATIINNGRSGSRAASPTRSPRQCASCSCA